MQDLTPVPRLALTATGTEAHTRIRAADPVCLPNLDTVVWRTGKRIVLPAVPGLSGITVRGINAAGWVAGSAGNDAVVGEPVGAAYEAINLGVLPRTTISSATGIDDFRRVVSYSTTQFFPPSGAPFMWSEATGLVDLSIQGFPNESPLAISLGAPGSVTPLAPPPPGFSGPGSYPAAINDAGDQVRF